MKSFKNIKLVQKISLLSISCLIFLTTVGFVSLKKIAIVNSKLVELNDSRMAPIIELENIKSKVEHVRSLGNSLMDASDDAASETVKKEILEYTASIDSLLSKYKNNAEFKPLLENYNNYIAARDVFIQSVGERFTGVQQGTQPGASENEIQQGPPQDVTNFDKTKNVLVASFDDIINKHVAAAKKTYEDSERTYRTTQFELTVFIIISTLIILALSVLITRSITIPIKRVTTKLEEISQSSGDLTQRICYKSEDEIGQLSGSFDIFMDKLQSIIKEVAASAETISISSQELNQAASASTQSLGQISNAIEGIAAGASDGAAAAEETTASLNEAAKFSEATLNASRNTTVNSKKAREAAEEGESKISEIVSSITDIAASSEAVSSMINELNKSSERIGDIIRLITAISEQTNLLALNAAIEAARAGEAGRGFSVVADEIRKLADESSQAAMEIAGLIKENQQKSTSAVASASQVNEKVSLGVERASEVGESIKNIIKNIQGIVSEIEQIDNANEQQAQSINEMERATRNIAATSNDIAEGTEGISASVQEQLSTMTEIEGTTEKLSNMAARLSEITSGFRV